MAASGSSARRYAEALISFAKDDRATLEFRVSLDQIAAALDRETIAVLRDPAMPIAKRQESLEIATKNEPEAVRSLLRLLIERDRLMLLPLIARALGDIVDLREGIAKARITTAVELDERERADVVRRLELASGHKVRATFAVDEALIGGAKVQLGDHLIDASLDAQLRALGRQLAT